MSKRNIAYIKPQDPKFLQQLKQQIGYKEGPSIETKKQKLDWEGEACNVDRKQSEDEKPQIVVINPGDLTAEEVADEEKRLAKEAAEAPADLSKPIIFRKRHKPVADLALEKCISSAKNTKAIKDKNTKQSNRTVNLSFDIEEKEEDQ